MDEAYMLVNESAQDFGQEATDTLLPQMEEQRDRLVVIAAGYPDRMDTFIRSNPGLRGRFRYRFVFEDYNPGELMQIFDLMLNERKMSIDNSARSLVEQEFKCRYEERDEEFDNARMVRRFIGDALDNMAERVIGTEVSSQQLTTEDILPLCASIAPAPRPLSEVMAELDKLVGLSSVKQQVREIVNRIKWEKRVAEHGTVSFKKPQLHSLFLGNPGTGKTTVARLMGEVYRTIGLLSRGHVIAPDRSDLIGQWQGQTAPLVRKKVRDALGGVLFLDEAYNLVINEQDLFGQEAIGVLLTEMENRSGQFVLIAAGYEREMNRFLHSNSGLKSRFQHRIHFDDYSPEELLQIFEGLVARKRSICGPGVREHVLAEFASAWNERTGTFANGRAVRSYFEKVMSRLAARVTALPDDGSSELWMTVITEDVMGVRLDRGDPQ